MTRRPRTSTIVLIGVFLGVLALYTLVRPVPSTAIQPAVNPGPSTPAPAVTPSPAPTRTWSPSPTQSPTTAPSPGPSRPASPSGSVTPAPSQPPTTPAPGPTTPVPGPTTPAPGPTTPAAAVATAPLPRAEGTAADPLAYFRSPPTKRN
jgi:hypothetical protein